MKHPKPASMIKKKPENRSPFSDLACEFSQSEKALYLPRDKLDLLYNFTDFMALYLLLSQSLTANRMGFHDTL
jgi:hypothetical protein